MSRHEVRSALGLFVAAFIVRALPASSVFSEGQVFLRDGDAYYHLRRALFAIENFPQTLAFDSYVQFPHGSKIIWPPFLDTCFAIVLWPFVELGGFDLATRAAAWLPPVIGGLTVVATWAITRRHFGERTALWAGGLLCVLGGHFVYSRLGAFDHHVVVSLMSVLLLGCGLRMLAGAGGRGGASVCGIVAGIALLVWPGCLLYVSLLLAGLAATALFAPDRERAAGRWRDLAWASACAGLLVAPFSLGAEWPQWSSMSPLVLTNFQPWLMGSTTALALCCALTTTRAPFMAGAGGRAAVFFGTGALILLASVLLSADLAQGFADAWRWLAKDEAFQGSVIESQPLFVVRGRVSGFMASLQLSPLVYAFPLLWLYGCYEARRTDAPGPHGFLLAWAGVLFAATLLQKRFLDTFTVAFAMQTAVSLDHLWRRIGLTPDGIVARLAPLGALAVLYPLHANYTLHLDNLLRAFQNEPLRLSTYHRADRIRHGVSRWLRNYTPPTSGWLDPSEQPEYAVLAHWNAGHMIQQVGRRPTVTDNFGDDAGAENFALAQRFWSASSHKADQILERLGVRYVMVTDGDPFLGFYGFYSMYRTLFLRDGSAVLARPGGGASTRASGRYRLLMESRPLTAKADRPFAKVFEFVTGAQLRGRTQPHTNIGLSLRVETNRGRSIQYRDRVKSGPDGRFEFIVPYATADGPDWLKVAKSYAMHCGLVASRMEVTEQQVRAGEIVWVGDPCIASPEPARKRYSRR